MSCDSIDLYYEIDSKFYQILFQGKTNDFGSEIIFNSVQEIWWFRFESFETGIDSNLSLEGFSQHLKYES